MAVLRAASVLILCAWMWAGASPTEARAAAPTEQQVKAVFLFNFSHFVAWPQRAFGAPADPFVIGILGGGAIADQLERAIQGESIDGRALQMRRFASPEQVGDCQILFIDRASAAQLDRILPRLQEHTLTVSDLDGAARRGVMIQMVNEQGRIRLLINLEVAQAAGLSISSNLLRPAEIIATGN